MDRAKYLTGGKSTRKLSIIDGLDIFNVRPCPYCDKLFRKHISWYAHAKDEHSELEYRRHVWYTEPGMQAQALSKKTGNEYFFLVAQDVVPEDESQLLRNLEAYDRTYLPEREKIRVAQ